MNQVVHLFTNSDLRSGHLGLTKIANKNKVNVTNLAPGEFVLFVNRRLTGMKAYGANNTVIYCKSPNDSRPFDPRTFEQLPQFIEGPTIRYKDALVQLMHKKYAHLFKEK